MKVNKFLSCLSYVQLNFKEFEINKSTGFNQLKQVFIFVFSSKIRLSLQFNLSFNQIRLIVCTNSFCSLLIGGFVIYTFDTNTGYFFGLFTGLLLQINNNIFCPFIPKCNLYKNVVIIDLNYFETRNTYYIIRRSNISYIFFFNVQPIKMLVYNSMLQLLSTYNIKSFLFKIVFFLVIQ